MAEYNSELSQSNDGTTLYLKPADGFQTSTKFGASVDDVHQFTGSVYLSGTLYTHEHRTVVSTTSSGSSYFGNDSSDIHIFTGSLIVSGTSNFIGDTEFDANITTNGNVNVSGAMYVVGPISSSGHAEFGGDVAMSDDLYVSGNVYVGGFLQGTSPLQVSGGLIVSGNTDLSGTQTITGGLYITGNLNVSGNTIYNYGDFYNYRHDNDLQFHIDTANEKVVINGALSASGHAEFGGDVVMTDNLLVSGGIQAGFAAGMGPGASHNLTGSVYVSGTLQVDQALTALNGVTVSAGALNAQAVTAEGLLTAEAGVVITGGSLSSSVHAEFGGDVSISDNLSVSGNITLGGAMAFATVSASGDGNFVTGLTTSGDLNVSGGALIYDGLRAGNAPGMGPASIHSFTGSLYVSGSTVIAGDFKAGSAETALTAPNITFEVHYHGTKNPTALGNDTGGGDVVYFGTGSVDAGYLYYLNSEGGWAKANANATGSLLEAGAGNSSLLGFSLVDGTVPVVGMLVRGFFDAETALHGTWSTGSVVYVHSGSTAGKVTAAAPSSSNSYVRAVGYCTNTPNVIYFNPDGTWVENE